MAVRLSVVMTESSPPGAAARLTEDVVGHLIGLPGVDLTLVRSLADLAESSSTDRLSLDAITADVAIIDWQSPSAIVETMNRIGFAADRWPHPGDPFDPPTVTRAATDGGSGSTVGTGTGQRRRRIYGFDLNRFSGPEQVINALRALQSSRQVRTFAIATPPSSPLPVVGPPATGAPTAPTPPPPQPTAAPTNRANSQIDLDDLIDELDRADM